MVERTDYERMAAVYDAGRSFPEAWLHSWHDAVGRRLSKGGPVLDVGSGTGIWSLLLAKWFDVDVFGIEPSDGMRGQAIRKRSHPRVLYVGGEAERLPFREGTAAAIWLSTVVHHIPDLAAAAAEFRRVLKPGGSVLIRNAFSERSDEIPWLEYFPAARPIAARRWPTVEATLEAFTAVGFEMESLERVHETTASDLSEYAQRIESRADSSLVLIDDEDFERGLAALRSDAGRKPPEPVVTGLDLLVLR